MAADRCGRRFGALLVAGLLLLGSARPLLAADRAEPLPGELEGVGVVEHLGDTLPLDRLFLDHDGRVVNLRALFGKGRPVLLTFNYSSCPMLCHVQRDGLLDVLAGLSWSVGREFDVITIGIDPSESPERSAMTRRSTLRQYGRPTAEAGWHYLTGREADIRAVADAAGFGYRYVPERGEYAHAAALIVCTPEGTIARYLYGVKYDPPTLRLSLLEAAEGKVGSPLEQILLYCFHYDPSTRRYAPAAMNLMRLGAVLAAGSLLTYLMRSWLRSRGESALPHGPTDGVPA